MSFVLTTPEFLVDAAADLTGIGSTIRAASTAAAAPTGGVLAAGADEVSAAVAAVFAAHAQGYQVLSAQAAAFHDQFVALVRAGAGQYAMAEAANASPLQLLEQQLLDVLNAPTTLLLGRPLIGNGANGAPGADGQPGGLLIGNGGAGGSGTTAHPAAVADQ
ncbi:PE-PGRS family protein PE_PGRS26 [Mycobacterium persicum]|nr:PE-PGRS family protein PE_PGRS26 [Mycobacterium persicum]